MASDPFAIKEVGGDIQDRNVQGFSERRFEGTSLGEPGLGTLRRVISQTTPRLMSTIAMLLCAVLLARLYYLQGVQGVRYRELAEGNRLRLETTAAPRGLITDQSGTVLASNTPSFRLVAVPADLPPDEAERQDLLTDLLAQVPTKLLDQDNLTGLTVRSYLPRTLAYDLPRTLALQLMIKAARYRGVRVETTSERSYNSNPALSNVLGYVGKISPKEYAATGGQYQLTDVVGKTGLELTYEQTLRGVLGRREVEVDAQGHERATYASTNPEPGAHLELTLNAELQSLSYQALRHAVPIGGKTGGSVVVLEPQTGAVLALVSYPGFDPNLFTVARDPVKVADLLQSPQQPFFNRATAGQYPSGSTIKPFLAAAGLQEGIITPDTTVLSTGGITLGDQFFADWKAGGHGLVNIYRAIAESVNTFFYLLGGGSADRPGLGISRLTQYLHQFKIDESLSFDLNGTRNGFLPTPAWKLEREHDRWYRGDTYNVSIGQGGLLVTPLHLAVAYAALVNGGNLPRPHLVQSVTTASGVRSLSETKSLGKVELRPDVFKVVQAAMRQTVVSGTARSLNALALAVAGKTGTAQTGTRTPPDSWFAGYAPAVNPEIVVVVMVEHGGEGSTVAVPIAKEIFIWYSANRAKLR